MCLFRQPRPNRGDRRRNRPHTWPVPGRFCRRADEGVRSFVTPVIRATLPSSAEARTTTPEPSFWRRVSTIWRRASRSNPSILAATKRTSFTLADVLQERLLRLPTRSFALLGLRAAFRAVERSRVGARWRRATSSSAEFSRPADLARRVESARWYSARARSPEMASMRRTPAAVDCFANNLEDADFAGARHVRAAAELLAVEAARGSSVGNGDHADVGLGVLVAEEGQRAGGERVVDIHDVGADFEILPDFFVHLLLDLGEFARDRRRRSAKNRSAGDRARRASRPASRACRECCAARRSSGAWRCGCACCGRGARVGDGGHAVAHVQIFLRDDAMRDQPGDRVVRAAHFGDFERFGIVVEASGVGHLAAGFGIDGRAVENDFRLRALLDFVYRTFFVTMASMRQSRVSCRSRSPARF